MTLAHLVTCGACTRHVRASEAACPFCGATTTAEARESSPRSGPAARLSRAGLVAFGIGAALVPLALADCAEPAHQTVYGGPPPDLAAPSPDGGHADAGTHGAKAAPSATPDPKK